METEVVCPNCGSDAIQEVAKRLTWQPVTLVRDENGELDAVDYGSFDYGDDVEHLNYECRDCETEVK